MSALFEFPLSSETLTADEVEEITGCSRPLGQRDWLKGNAWAYHTSRSGAPIVGRMYARLRMAGIDPSAIIAPASWAPDFAGVSGK